MKLAIALALLLAVASCDPTYPLDVDVDSLTVDDFTVKPSLMYPGMKIDPNADLGKIGREFAAAAGGDLDLDPVVVVPGLAGSQLEEKLDKPSVKHFYCAKKSSWKTAWLAVTELLTPACLFNNIKLLYQSEGRYENQTGVKIRTVDFGGMGGINYLDPANSVTKATSAYFITLTKSFQEVGYEVGKNLVGAPYDWRQPPTSQHSQLYFSELAALIETTYAKNGNKTVHLIGHSMGGTMANYFLSTRTAEWKDTYIKSFISMGAPYYGAAKALRAIISGDDFGLAVGNLSLIPLGDMAKVSKTYGGVVWLIPTVYNGNGTIVSTGSKDYNASQYGDLFSDMKAGTTKKIYESIENVTLTPFMEPGVKTHCLYGSDLDTEGSYYYKKGKFDKNPDITYVPGDGTVPTTSLHACKNWTQPEPVITKSFKKADHFTMVQEPRVINYLLGITTHVVSPSTATNMPLGSETSSSLYFSTGY